MSENIFRKTALEKLSTPEKLDQLITVANPRAWLMLITLGLAIMVLVFWGIFGSVNTRVQGTGMIVGLGVHDVVPLAAGQIEEVLVTPGNQVEVGQVIAKVSQPVLEQQIEQAEARLADQRTQLAQARLFGNKDVLLQGDFIAKQKKNLEQSIQDTRKILEAQIQEVEIKKSLLADGLITRPELLAAQQRVDATRGEIEKQKAEIKYISTEEATVEANLETILLSSSQSLEATQLLIKQLKARLELHANIKSPYEGEVLELLVEMGDMVEPGFPVVKITKGISGDEALKVVLYVPAKDGKKLKEGMEALVSPATVKPQEYGYMNARILYVSEYPATRQGIMRNLKNEQLVQQMLALGAPFEVHAEFYPAPESPTGYRWTSGKGPEGNIYPGTPCSARVTVETQRPITIVMPALKQMFD